MIYVRGKPVNIVFLYLYVAVCLIGASMLLREYILARKIKQEELDILYCPSKVTNRLKIALHIISHILYWVILISEYQFLIIILSPVFLETIPQVISGCVYVGDSFFIYDGWKYDYDAIDTFEDSAFYKIELSIEGKKRIIKGGNHKRYEAILKVLKDNIKSAHLS